MGLHYPDWRMLPDATRGSHRRVLDDGRHAVDQALERLAGRPEVLAVSVGNEVPADLVRVHGIRAVEDTLAELVGARAHRRPAHAGDVQQLPDHRVPARRRADLACFNVFLERPSSCAPYLRHLQRCPGDRPLLITELGLAGESCTATRRRRRRSTGSSPWSTRPAARAPRLLLDRRVGRRRPGRRGLGLRPHARRPHSPSPRSAVSAGWANRDVRDLRASWPSLTVVVCAYNEEQRIAECLDSLASVDYPDLEVIVCDDGSTDATLEIARRYPFRVLALPHGGPERGAQRRAGRRARRDRRVPRRRRALPPRLAVPPGAAH